MAVSMLGLDHAHALLQGSPRVPLSEAPCEHACAVCVHVCVSTRACTLVCADVPACGRAATRAQRSRMHVGALSGWGLCVGVGGTDRQTDVLRRPGHALFVCVPPSLPPSQPARQVGGERGNQLSAQWLCIACHFVRTSILVTAFHKVWVMCELYDNVQGWNR